jgi:hypothetical protein
VKRAFDPAGILTPGAKVPLEGERAIADVKYAPSLPALPEPARVAHARVERERAYARPRLALLDEAARLAPPDEATRLDAPQSDA